MPCVRGPTCNWLGSHLNFTGCKDLLKQLLRSNPDVRVKMPDIMKHSWMNEGHTLPFGHAQFPNKLEYSDVNLDILQHMVNHLKVSKELKCHNVQQC